MFIETKNTQAMALSTFFINKFIKFINGLTFVLFATPEG